MKFTQTIALLSVAATALAQDFCNAGGHSGQSVECTSNKTGNIGGVGYELWSDSGNNSATFYSDGSFKCSFQGAGDYLCRSGLSFDSTKTPAQIGRLKADFKLVKGNVSGAQYSYVGIYGWTRSPLVEYYIVDNWLGSKPGDWVGNKKHGAFTIDGASYTVYENTRTGPSIDGDTTFKQYFSIRDSPRECGTIDISAHFDQWEKLGMTMGKLHEAKILGEAGGGTSGTIDFPYAKVYTGEGGGASAGGAPAGGAPAGNDAPAGGAPAGGDAQAGNNAPAGGAPAGGDQGGQNFDWNQGGQQQGGQQGGNPWEQQGNQGWNQGGQQGGNPWDQGNQGWNQGNQGWNQGNQGWNQGGQQWGGQDWNQGWNQGNQGWNQGGNQGWGAPQNNAAPWRWY